MCRNVSARFVLWLISFLGYAVQYMLLTNLNIAITDMIEKPHINVTTYSKNSSKSNEVKFTWNEVEQGLVLSGVYWILWISHLVGGTLSHKFGAKIVIGYSILFGSVLTFLIPEAAVQGIKVLLVVRILQGFAVGLSFPSVLTVMQYWIPENENGKFLTCILGISFGAAGTYFISGFIIKMFQWKGVFYVTGSIGLVWCVTWWYLMYNKPEKHPRILEKEMLYILSKTKKARNVQNLASSKRRRIPWIQILTTIEFYASAIGQFGVVWVLFTVLIYGPTYVKLFHNLDPVMTGVISGLPHFVRVVFTIAFATIMDKVIAMKVMTLTNARKVSTFFSNIFPGIALIFLAYFGENFPIVVASLFLTVILSGAIIPGTLAGVVDMSPNFGGVLQGLCGMVSHTCGFLVPLLVGYLTLNNDTIEQWQSIFLIGSAISIVSGLIVICFWNSDVQEWDRDIDRRRDQSHIQLNSFPPAKIKNAELEKL